MRADPLPAEAEAVSGPETMGEGRRRVVIEAVAPQVDGGRFAVKRVVGDTLVVEADVFADGYDEVRVQLRWSHEPSADEPRQWQTAEMEPLGNDRWRASFVLLEIGRYQFGIRGWTDQWRTWVRDLAKRLDARQDVTVDLQIGARIMAACAARAVDPDHAQMISEASQSLTAVRATSPELGAALDLYPDLSEATTTDAPLPVTVDPLRARFSAWYEMFPRSASPNPARHGTFDDVIARLPYLAELGIDVLYLPPIHPIGRKFRKGPDSLPSTAWSDPGVPWAIGGATGGHTAIHPELGDMAGFERLVHEARRRNMDVALDIAFQTSPDHPWLHEHPEWFRARPDGSIQYAENPPKKYEDIYPFDFESAGWPALWQALADVFRFWIGHGVNIFRVDNPHTKSFAFWEWCIGTLKAEQPQVIFLAEAFTRPKVMYRLAKLGFSQSYTYFTWRNTPAEMREYLEQLCAPPLSDFFRPSFWPNTPDILHADLQTGGRAAFAARLVLAATLSPSYGIYGPAYELGVATAREPDSEEYLDSEKYQQRTWELDSPNSLRGFIARINTARRAHEALQSNEQLSFMAVDNRNLLAYTKTSADGRDVILGVVNFDYRASQSGTVTLNLAALGLPIDGPFEALDLLDGRSYAWSGPRAWVQLDPAVRSAHLFWLRPVGAAGVQP